MEIPSFNIETVADVKEFFTWLVNNEWLIHPDDRFIDEVEEGGDLTIDNAVTLDNIMDKCFDVCEEYGVEIYELAYGMAMESDEE